ncbi:choice-of-anchor U domain-containing protein [Ramlibacter sp.]|uniref:beta strand repeat-containing protein n=1 Tax=Ramlibacter sp. TaxID=1917967 RepID=UPI002D3B7722|nr:choice-of-anchor U domain-containing protein [Ramlibacter sp.]HYD75388.1 choice-of-anchor U domain-containing protein [Ramlibacter sp.]
MPIENFDLVVSVDPGLAVLQGPAAGAAGWTVLANPDPDAPGSLLIGGYSLTPLAPGGTILTLSFQLTDPAATSLSLSYEGTFNADGELALTGLVLGDGTITQNAPAQGQPVITGTATEDQVLSVDTSGISDGDGLGTGFSYQWLRDGTEIDGATDVTYQLGDADAGRSISVRVAWQDGAGNAESLTSAATSVANVNDAPAGDVMIAGAATRGVTLTATHTLTDDDGMGSVTYQWLADGTAIAGATGSSYQLTDAEVGKAISVRASYTDGQGTPESKTSAATALVVANNLPTGEVTISGTPTQGQTLTASNDLADPDGLGTIAYQWYAGGDAIAGATGSTLELAQEHVGKTITVVASYTDVLGNEETRESLPTASVANTNDDPTGAVTISGTATEGETLTATHNLADADGLATVSWQWYAGGVAIEGATGETLVLAQAQVGEAITVVASYTDGFGKAESVTSTATAVVQNVNDPATGTVTVTGTYTQGETLTASNTLADEDGFGTIQYQWLADGEAIAGATNDTLVLTQAQVGKVITVQASFVDQQGTAESATSSADGVDPVEDIDDSTIGTVVIVGAATKGQTLSIDNTLADPDGIIDGAAGFTYEWLANGTELLGAGSTYTLTDNELGDTISVRVTYNDAFGTHSKTSASTAPVILNNLATGTVTITGDATEGQTLMASSLLTDLDNDGGIVPSVTYHWMADGFEVGTGSSFTLTQAQVGKAITVEARFTDKLGTPESVISAPTAEVANVNQPASGAVTISGTVQQGQVLTAVTTELADQDGLGPFSYQWFADGAEIAGATSQTFTPTQAEVDQALTVKVSYTDAWGGAESVTSAATAAVANANDLPTGDVTIAGTFTQGQMLTASHTLADLDGLGPASYQWFAGGTAISGATGQTFVLTQAEVGKAISVRASYKDGFGQDESLTSAVSAVVANLNDGPTGAVTVSGNHVQGQTLIADSSTLADADGMTPVTYQWLANGTDIAGATGATFTLTQAEVGKQVTVRASYTDALGTPESVVSLPAGTVANTNDAPSGTVTVTGSHVQGETLTASNDLADADGMGTVSYQWLSDGTAIAGATGTTYTLTEAEVGKQVTVRASYTDLLGQAEAVTSTGTGSVGNVNDSPMGAVTISGTPQQGQVLTAVTSALADPDGLGSFSYQWLSDGAVITGATGATFTPGQAEVGTGISVRVTYTDGHSTVETVTSAAGTPVANANDAPTGTVSIGGTPTEGETLTASNTLEDLDGMGALPVSYQWFADGQAIIGATGATLVLAQAQVGKAITVQASYTDGFGQAESRASAATARVANVNDAVSGSPAINGAPTQGALLTAVTSGLSDEDGLGAFSYQWLADGQAIAGATAATLALTQAQVNKAISVRVTYTDGFGATESATSAETAAVANVNDAATGAVLAQGARVAGMPMTADASSLADLDGLGTLSYQWYLDDAEIVGATNATYTPVAADGGKAIKVTVTYTDGFGTVESVTSAAVNLMKEDDAPAVVIDGVVGLAGDGNNDGIVDSAQDQVISAPFTAAASNQDVFVTLVADSTADGSVNAGSTTQFQNVRQEAPPAERPAALDMPLGLIDFTAVVASFGKTESFSLFVDANLGVNGYWKKDADGIWHNLASAPYGGSTTTVGNKIRLDFQIKDGGRFDNDGVENGVITDPGAIGAMELSVVGYAPDVVLTPNTHFFF